MREKSVLVCALALALNRNSIRRKAFGRIASHLNNNMLEYNIVKKQE